MLLTKSGNIQVTLRTCAFHKTINLAPRDEIIKKSVPQNFVTEGI